MAHRPPHVNHRPRSAPAPHSTPAQRRGPAPPPRRRRPRLRWGRLAALGLALLLVVGGALYFLLRGPGKGPPWVIALDAGHGGNDVGAIGLVDEVVLTEATVAQLEALLEADENFKPVLTRKAGKGADINTRTKRARRAGAHLLLSVHGNSDTSPDSSGFECFPTPPGRELHEESLRLAGLVAAEMGAAGARLRGEGGIRYAYYNEAGEKRFAEASDLTVSEERSFGLVEDAECPALLAEQCFITNAADLAAFGGEEGCLRAAQCYYRAICAYFGVPPVAA